MPRTKSKSDEIDEIVDDLEDLEDEDLETVDEDPDEAPKKSRSRKSKAAKAKKEKPEKTGIGTADVAEIIGTSPRELRVFLRKTGYQSKDDRDGRYNWSGPNDPEVKQIVKEFRADSASAANREATKQSTGKKSAAKKSQRTKRVVEIEEDEDDE